MAGEINLEIITGNLARSPEIHVFDSGKRKASLRIGCYCGGRGDDARTLWVDAVYWPRDGHDMIFDALELMEKGDRVIVQGRPDIEQWAGREGPREKRILVAFAIMRVPREQRSEAPPAQRDEPPPPDDEDSLGF